MGMDEEFAPAPKEPTAEESAAELKLRSVIREMAAKAAAIQRQTHLSEAIAELEVLVSAGRPDFSPDYEAMWKAGVKQAINRLKALMAT